MKFRGKTHIKILAAILSGLLLSLGFPGYSFPNLALPYIVALAFIPLFLVLFGKKTAHPLRDNILLVWVFGFTFQVTSFFWISQPIIYFSGFSELTGYLLFLSITLLTSIYFVFLLSPILIYLWLEKRQKLRFLHFFIFSILVTVLEIIIPRFFEWSIGQLSNSIYFWQLSSIFGFNTGTFFILFTNLTLAYGILHYRQKPFFIKTILINAGVWTSILLFGFLRINTLTPEIEKSQKIRVAFIQPNFTFQELASKRIHAKNAHEISLDTVLKMSTEVVDRSIAYDHKRPDLLIWPESVAPDRIFTNKTLQDIVSNHSKELGVPILLQDVIQTQKNPTDKTWSIWSASKIISSQGLGKETYEKWVPIPFGEAVPFEGTFPKLGKLYRNLIQNSSKVEIGHSFKSLSVLNKFDVAPLICFDSINQRLPYLQAKYGNADLFVNQANFMWMVNSNAGLEFSYLDKARAIENSRSMIMVANTGPTIAFDPLGRIIWGPSDVMSSDSNFFDIPLYDGKTIFSFLYNWPLIFLAIWSLYKLIRLLRSKSS